VRRVLEPEQRASSALALFRITHDDCIPVVNNDQERQFLGIVRRRDVVGYLMQREQSK
jgi:CBS domain-containing protein